MTPPVPPLLEAEVDKQDFWVGAFAQGTSTPI